MSIPTWAPPSLGQMHIFFHRPERATHRKTAEGLGKDPDMFMSASAVNPTPQG